MAAAAPSLPEKDWWAEAAAEAAAEANRPPQPSADRPAAAAVERDGHYGGARTEDGNPSPAGPQLWGTSIPAEAQGSPPLGHAFCFRTAATDASDARAGGTEMKPEALSAWQSQDATGSVAQWQLASVRV